MKAPNVAAIQTAALATAVTAIATDILAVQHAGTNARVDEALKHLQKVVEIVVQLHL